MSVPKILLNSLGFSWRSMRGKNALLAYQEKSFRKLLKFAYHNSPFYKEIYSSHGIKPRDLDDVSYNDLPIITKDMVVNNMDDVFTNRRLHIKQIYKWLENHPDPEDQYYKNYFVLHSSGSSNKPLFNVYSKEDLFMTTACIFTRTTTIKDYFAKTVFIGATMGHYTGISLIKVLKSIGLKFDTISINLPIDEIVQQLNEIKPNRLIAYGTLFSELLRQYELGNLKIYPTIINVSGDGMSDAVAKKLKKTWKNVRLVNNYVCTEAMVIGTNYSGGNSFDVYDDHTMVQVYDNNAHKLCKNGVVGNILVTNLHNYTTPIIRYKLDDMGKISDSTKHAKRIVLNKVRVASTPEVLCQDKKTGKTYIDKIHISLLANIVIEGLYKYQFHFINEREIAIRYVADKNLSQKLKKLFNDILKVINAVDDYKVSVRKVDSILPEKNGKTPIIKVESVSNNEDKE